ncbi:hypothetical protein [Paracoccus cavernae]|uniref:hypothetical protein n=1 Tax=Paracoccus cavernae TaxID=1571207 RepID=UPI003639F30B
MRAAAAVVVLVVLALIVCPRLAARAVLASRLVGVSLQWRSAAVVAAVLLMIRGRQRMAGPVRRAGLLPLQP